jgi:hypothetical protein
MTNIRSHRKDQAGLTNATITMIYGVLGATFVGTLQQFAFPAFAPFEYRLLLIGCLAAQAACLYLMIRMGGSDDGSEHREWYLRFHAGLADNGAGSVYARGVRKALAWIDQFFDDVDRSTKERGQGLFPTAFGLLAKPAPLWTAQSYDRCLLLALLYPLLVVFLGWVVSGEVLGLEEALGMRAVPWPYRTLAAALMLAALPAAGLAMRFHGWRRALLLTISVFLAVSPSWLGAGVALSFGFGACLFLFDSTHAKDDVFESGIILISSAVVFTTVVTFGVTPALVACAASGQIAFFAIRVANRKGRLGLAQGGLTLALLAITLASPIIGVIGSNERTLHLLFFVGLLTLVNAPFDWLALGLSRALLRRGLERGGMVPLWLGLVDIALSLVLMSLLAIAVLWSAALFDWATLSGGNPPILDPEFLLAELRAFATPGNTHYWWLYAMLFSTQIPALVNAIFGLFCLLRGATRINAWMLDRLPVTGGIGVWQRITVASVWAAQLGVAVALGLLGAYSLFAHAIPAIDPAFGGRLVEMLEAVRILPIRPPGMLLLPAA